MTKKILTASGLLSLFFMFSIALAGSNIMVHDAWVRSAPPNAQVLAAYMEIMNKSGLTKLLTSVSSPGFKKVEMHKTEMHDGMMKMVPQKQLVIPAGSQLTLKPGGYHLMLMKPKSTLHEGEHVNLELHFDNSETVTVKALVRKGSSKNKHHQHSKH